MAELPTITLYRRSPDGPWWYDFYAGRARCRASCRTRDRSLAEQRAGAALDAALAAIRPASSGGAGGQDVELRAELAALQTLDLARASAEGVTAKQRISIDGCWRHLIRLLGAKLNPALVDYDLVESYIRRRRDEGVRGQSVRKEVQALRRGLRIAARRGWLRTVPELPVVRSSPRDARRAGKLIPADVLGR